MKAKYSEILVNIFDKQLTLSEVLLRAFLFVQLLRRVMINRHIYQIAGKQSAVVKSMAMTKNRITTE